MLARYINLSQAIERRSSLEANLQALPVGQWQVQRFEAINTTHDVCRRISGRISAREKACFLSHRSLLTEMLQTGNREPFMVWEDDVMVGQFAHEAVMRFQATASPDTWDILYTDLTVPDLGTMLNLMVRARPLRARRELEVLDLASMPFAGTIAYLIRPDALPRVTYFLNSFTSLDEPIDSVFRRLIHSGQLKGRALFPFVTTASAGSIGSQIQPDQTCSTDLAWMLFRMLMSMECNVEKLYPLCNQLSSAHPDPEASVMGVITAAMLSSQFKPK